MNVEEVVRNALREQAEGQPPVGPGFADRVLAARRRRRVRGAVSVAVATAAVVVGVSVTVPVVGSGEREVRPAGVVEQRDVHAHPDQSPPRDLVAAGDVALAAYYTSEVVARSESAGVAERTYHLLDPRSGRYEEDDRWSFVAVAPGLRTAAVLERELPARRIGLLDLASGEVERWIPVEHGVGGLAFSPDGKRLVATAYAEHPDLREPIETEHGEDWTVRFGEPNRLGFHLVELSSGESTWSPVEPRDDINHREDFAFGADGTTVWSRVVGSDSERQYHAPTGEEIPAPAPERHLVHDAPAGLSPDGTLAAGGLGREAGDKAYTDLLDPRSGKRVAEVRGSGAMVWADERRLITWERLPGSGTDSYRPRMVLVTVGSEKVVPLTGVREPNQTLSRTEWEPVFARR
ncbi:WD40 repeat domain-containing protein [Streptomyces sp. JB150]|uniref:WD40 repeat domain-containing protein n=1 Tax=Streptomyces sp. JB150 TaxID=2714844 RepID=UPI001409ECA3|nr:WD40 repeat domain-containing protein [Streptomyces sp. JB150]QIJ62000.1 WD40 repeat domain-containing protein [Streptomyces sp. JB150]